MPPSAWVWRALARVFAASLLVLVLTVLLSAVFSYGASNGSVYGYQFRGYAVLLEASSGEPVYVVYRVSEGYVMYPIVLEVDGAVIRIILNCGKSADEPGVVESRYIEETEFGAEEKKVYGVLVPATCNFRLPLLWAVVGMVDSERINETHYSVMVTLRLGNVFREISSGGSLSDVLEGRSIAVIRSVELLALETPGGYRALLEPRDKVSLSFNYTVAGTNLAVDSKGGFVGFNQFYLFYPNTSEEYFEWRDAGTTFTLYGVPVHLVPDATGYMLCSLMPVDTASKAINAVNMVSSGVTVTILVPLIDSMRPLNGAYYIDESYYRGKAPEEIALEIARAFKESKTTFLVNRRVPVEVKPGISYWLNPPGTTGITPLACYRAGYPVGVDPEYGQPGFLFKLDNLNSVGDILGDRSSEPETLLYVVIVSSGEDAFGDAEPSSTYYLFEEGFNPYLINASSYIDEAQEPVLASLARIAPVAALLTFIAIIIARRLRSTIGGRT